jgi:sugar phosphate isomerase/epimerase
MLKDIQHEHVGIELWLATTNLEQRQFFKEHYSEGFASVSCHTAMANTYDPRILKEEIKFCGEIDARILVVHPRSLGLEAHTFDYAWHKDLSRDQLEQVDEFLAYAMDHHVVLALENGPMDVLEQVTEHVGKPHPETALGICVDTGHAAIHHQKQSTYLVNMLEAFHSYLVQLHIHDNHGTVDDHLVPGTGTILWNEVIASLGSLREHLPLVFELKSDQRPIDDLKRSMQFVSEL